MRPTRRRPAFPRLVIALGLTALGACSDPHLDLAEAGLLRVEDFPPGFRALSPDEVVAPAGSDGEAPEECAAVERASDAGVDATASSDAFASAESVAGNEVIVYRQEEVARRLVEAWSSETEAVPCVELLLSAIIGVAAQDPLVAAAVGGYDVAAAPLPVPAWGEARVAWRGTLSLEGPEGAVDLYVDVVVVGVGRAVSTFFVVGQAAPADGLREAVVPPAVDRLIEAGS